MTRYSSLCEQRTTHPTIPPSEIHTADVEDGKLIYSPGLPYYLWQELSSNPVSLVLVRLDGPSTRAHA